MRGKIPKTRNFSPLYSRTSCTHIDRQLLCRLANNFKVANDGIDRLVIRFEGEAGLWVLDGKRLGSAPQLLWSPWPGKHQLSLNGRDGRPLHSVHFEVRGAGVKTAAAGR